MQAAKRAFTQLARKGYNGEACEIKFTIQECTQGKDKKQKTYRGERMELDTPQTIERGGQKYTIRYKNVVKSVKSTGGEDAE